MRGLAIPESIEALTSLSDWGSYTTAEKVALLVGVVSIDTSLWVVEDCGRLIRDMAQVTVQKRQGKGKPGPRSNYLANDPLAREEAHAILADIGDRWIL